MSSININKDFLGNVYNDLEPKVLWKNPNITAEFPEQDITLSSDDYNRLVFYASYDPKTSNSFMIAKECVKGYGVELNVNINMNLGTAQSNGVRIRQIARVNDTIYHVSNCLCREDSGTSDVAQRSDRVIPYAVIGYKY